MVSEGSVHCDLAPRQWKNVIEERCLIHGIQKEEKKQQGEPDISTPSNGMACPSGPHLAIVSASMNSVVEAPLMGRELL